MDIQEIKKRALPVLRKCGARRASLFGSAARGEMEKGSDIDILIELPRSISLIGFIGVKHALEDALGKKVDLVNFAGIKPALRENILNSQVPLL